MIMKYIEKILSARVYDVAVETPLEKAKNLSLRQQNNVLLKREDLQAVFSFKLRGAYNCIYQLTRKKTVQESLRLQRVIMHRGLPWPPND